MKKNKTSKAGKSKKTLTESQTRVIPKISKQKSKRPVWRKSKV